MVNRLSRIKRVQRRRNKFQALCICKRRGDNADNLRRRRNLNDVGNANNVDSSADNGGIAVYFGRRLESGGGGIHRSKIKFKIEKQGAALMDTKNLTVAEIAERIINGERLKNSDDVNILLDAELDEVQRGAGSIQKHFCGNHIDLCTIINGKSGRCGENCKYCAQSACHKTGVEVYDFLPREEIFNAALANEKAGVNRFSIVTSGRALSGADFEKAVDAYKFMNDKLKIDLCASHGILTADQFKRLRAVGVKSYHHNIETSRRFFPQICTSHTYEDRINTIKLAQAAGLSVCSGGIIGMGENWRDRLDMAFELSALGIKSIPINVLNPVKGTALENRQPLEPNEILRTIAIFRFINPDTNIRLAAGRKFLPDKGASAFLYGASASITGNMLTTSGTTIKGDFAILAELGLTNKTS